MYSSTCFTFSLEKNSLSGSRLEGCSQDFEGKPVLAPRGVKGLYEVGGVAEEHGVAGGPAHHAQHRQPHVREGLRGEPGAVEIKNHADEGRSAIIKLR